MHFRISRRFEGDRTMYSTNKVFAQPLAKFPQPAADAFVAWLYFILTKVSDRP